MTDVRDASASASARAPYRPGAVVLRNAWYGLAPSADVNRRPIARMIDSTPIALWRAADGSVVGLEDRCAHRRTPLSAGKIVDGCIQCPYHGWAYDVDGVAVKIPSLGPGVAPPAPFTVPAYPVIERYGIVWVWWGDESAVDPSLVPDIPFLAADGGKGATFSTIHYSAPQELVIENLLDLTHLDFVHGAVFGDPYGGIEDINVEHTDEIIIMRRLSYDRRPPKLLAPVMGNPEKQDIAQTFYVHLRAGTAIGIAWNTPPGWGFCLLMCATPDSPMTTCVTSAGLVIGGPWWYRKTAPLLSRTVVARQDERIFRLQAPRYRTDDARADKSVPADSPGLRYRALRSALATRQADGDLAYRPGFDRFDTAEAIYAGGPPTR